MATATRGPRQDSLGFAKTPQLRKFALNSIVIPKLIPERLRQGSHYIALLMSLVVWDRNATADQTASSLASLVSFLLYRHSLYVATRYSLSSYLARMIALFQSLLSRKSEIH